MNGLCFYSGNHTKVHEKSIIRISPIPHRGIGRPFRDGNATPFGWACPLGITQVFRVSLPTDLTKLLIDHVPCFRLRFHPLAGCFPRLFLSAFRIDLFRSYGCFFSLFDQFFLFSLFRSLFHRSFLCGWFWHDKWLVLIIPVPVGLHKPFAKAVSHLKQGFPCLNGTVILMNCLVPVFS